MAFHRQHVYYFENQFKNGHINHHRIDDEDVDAEEKPDWHISQKTETCLTSWKSRLPHLREKSFADSMLDDYYYHRFGARQRRNVSIDAQGLCTAPAVAPSTIQHIIIKPIEDYLLLCHAH